MTVVYKSGRKHNDADCLSRAPVEAGPACTKEDDDECFLGALDVSDMAALQRDDPELRALIEHLEGQGSAVPRGFVRTLPTFSIRQGVLYKENFSDNNTAWLLVIPSSLREEIFQACHDDPTAGHLGYSRTLARIREKYYWPKLAKTVPHYTRSCHECQRRRSHRRDRQDFFSLLRRHLPHSSNRRKPFHQEVAKFFIESIVLRHGAPEVLISDRGSSFMAQLTQEVLRLSHTSHRRTTAYHPQTNGLTERLNKTIADMISMYVDVEHKTWDEVLPYVTFAYNTAVQETTGVTPFQLVHGRKVTTMLDAMLPHEPAVDASDDAQVVAQRAEEVRQLARLRIKAQQRVDTGRYNLRRRDVHFQPGDRVWVWTPIRRRGLSEKLLKRYFGPYKVLRRLGDLNYEVMPDGTRTSRRPPRPEVVHVVRLKPYYAR
ncbi:DDE-type integrase/transposase/recombinase [Ixodes scapularis]